MAFDDYLQDLGPKKQGQQVPEIVTDTLNMGYALIDVDYLPMLIKSPDLIELVKDEKEMNLKNRGWAFQFGTSRSWAGLCTARPTEVLVSKNKNILVSIDFVKGDDNWKKTSKDTILHEIAHGIVTELFYFGSKTMSQLKQLDPQHFSKEGHGNIWEKVCVAINENGDCGRFYNELKENSFFKKYRYICMNCNFRGYGNYNNFAEKCSRCFKPILVEGNI